MEKRRVAFMLIFLGAPIDITALVVILTSTRLGFLLPIPGGLGSVEAALIWSLTLLGYPGFIGASSSVFIRIRDISLGLLGLAVGKKWQNYGERTKTSS